jgi:hypothetical protein
MSLVSRVQIGHVGLTLGGVGRLSGYTGLAGGGTVSELGDWRRAPKPRSSVRR